MNLHMYIPDRPDAHIKKKSHNKIQVSDFVILVGRLEDSKHWYF